MTSIPKSIINNEKLIWNLGRDDFKKKFAGSYLGIIWAFVQPIVTILVYWFVFDKALNAGTQVTKSGIQAPYVLWLTAGMVPWFFFSDAVSSGTNALLEYSFLVKKVVFNIEILPTVKMMSSFFVHLFFIGFTLVFFTAYGYIPSIYAVQMLYYSFCMFFLVAGIVYFTSAVVVFFRDLSQIVGIVLQILVWMTPIMWNIDGMISQGRISNPVQIILKLNPMYYIVSGYRDSLLNRIWFFERGMINLYFWGVTIVLLLFGNWVFKRLQPHFADIL
ncbi:ABC transporter permease [Lachnospiraceae bacterium YH-ros2228]